MRIQGLQTVNSPAFALPPFTSFTTGRGVSGVREAIEKAGASLLLLPPYSPDFNPIEMAFSKLKALLRKAAARNVDDLWTAIADCLGQFSPTECQNYFQAAGYDRSNTNGIYC